MPELQERKISFYEKYIKRILDIICSLLALIVFSWLYIVIAVLVRVNLGSPVLFKQPRPGKDEKIFNLYKFRTMTDERDVNGDLLPDDVRLTKFGAWLRNSSLDEIPEAINILKGDMSVIGPRPQLVRDMVFMTPKQRQRHTARPGLSGLAQVSGRNAISWEGKLDADLRYIDNISFLNDVKIVLLTVKKAFFTHEGADSVAEESMDFGDWLLSNDKISKEKYIMLQKRANSILVNGTEEISYDGFSVAMSVYKNDNANYLRCALDSITIKQTKKPNQIVLVEDGPITDDLESIIEQYVTVCSNLGIELKIVKLDKNQGLGIALREAVNNCDYSIIARMDSDDISVDNRFEQQIDFMRCNPTVDILSGDIQEFIDVESNVVGKRVVPTTNEEICEYIKYRCPINHVAAMFKKESVQNAGGYLDWHYNEDYYLWLRMYLNNVVFANTGTVLVNVRVGKEMYQRRGGIKYFISEIKLQNYMLKNGIIGVKLWLMNVLKRFIVQILLPNRIRGFVFRAFARTN